MVPSFGQGTGNSEQCGTDVLECVVNVSEGRRLDVVAGLVAAVGHGVLDVHHDPDHNRTVVSLVGADGARRLAAEAVRRLDLATHDGVHPRIGVVDVVPFVPLEGSTIDDALAARDAFAAWIAGELGVPAFLYGPERTLPDVRRHAFRDLAPDVGPPTPHPTAGGVAVGARPVLVAYNLWLASSDVTTARAIASELRSPVVRALGLPVAGAAQVSLNLLDPVAFGPAAAYDAVAARAEVARAELVGLVPEAVLAAVAPDRWAALDLAPDRTIEARLARLDTGRG